MFGRFRPIVLFAATSAVLTYGCGTADSPTEVVSTSPDGVAISGTADTVIIGATLQLQATVAPASAPQALIWTSSDPFTGVVDPNGVVLGVTPGPVTVTAASLADPSVRGTFDVEVVDCPTPRLVTGDIDGDATWENWLDTPLCFDYLVESSTTVTNGLLTLEPGTIVGFEDGRLLITSTAGLNAVGTEDDPIRLTGSPAERGTWDGVMLQGTRHLSNRMERTSIEYAGGSSFGGGIQASNLILVQSARMPLERLTLEESAGYGVYMTGDSEIPGGYVGGAITRNATGAAHLDAAVVHLLSESATLPEIGGNDRDRIDIAPGTVSRDGTWRAFLATYNVLASPTKMGVVSDLTLAPGVIIEFEPNQAISVSGGGRLTAIGTADEWIQLTGTELVPGSWRGLQIQDTNTRLEYVDISFGGGPGGSGSLQPANLKLASGAAGTETRLTLRNSVLRNSAGYGLSTLATDQDIEAFDDNLMFQNDLGPAYVAATHVKYLTSSSSFLGNSIEPVVVQVTGADIDTDAVTWQAIGVPYRLIGVGASPVFSIVNSQFSVEPGVEMLMQSNMGFNFRSSSVTMEGTQLNPIRMAGDGAAWAGLQLFEGSASFDWVNFVNVGSSSWGGVNEAAAVSITSAGTNSSSASFTGDVTSSGGSYALAFSFGPTTAQGCIAPTYIPPPDQVGDHCTVRITPSTAGTSL